MIKKIILIVMIGFITSCSIMPGLQNPDMSAMQKNTVRTPVTITPTLIPITPALIADQHVSTYIYQVAPADVLNINVWQHPEFTPRELQVNQVTGIPSTQGAAGQEGYLVNPQGYIYFPLVGRLLVANKTVDQIRQNLTIKLRHYIRHPNLNVRVVDFRGRKAYVIGEVMKPGFIPLNDQPLSITDAIVMKGGLDPNAADPSHIYVIRGNMTRPSVYWLQAKTPDSLLLAEHFNLQPGDILFVSSAPATRWNRVINQLLPSIQTIWYTRAILHSDNN